MFTAIIVVCSLKSMCILNFILIGCCVSELCGHLCPYRNVWPEAVYCCFTRTTLFTKFWYVYIIVFMDFYQFTKFRLLIQSEIRELKNWKVTTTTTRKWRIVKMNFYNFNDFPMVRFWSFFEDLHILTIGTLSWRWIPDRMPIATETRIFWMYGSDAGQPVPSLYIQRGYRPFVIINPTAFFSLFK